MFILTQRKKTAFFLFFYFDRVNKSPPYIITYADQPPATLLSVVFQSIPALVGPGAGDATLALLLS